MNRWCPEPSKVSCACKCSIKTGVEWMSERLNKWMTLKGPWGFSDGLNYCYWHRFVWEVGEHRLGMLALSCSKGSPQWGVKCTVLCGNAPLYSCWASVWDAPRRLEEPVFRITWRALKAVDFRANTQESLCSLPLISWRSERKWVWIYHLKNCFIYWKWRNFHSMTHFLTN